MKAAKFMFSNKAKSCRTEVMLVSMTSANVEK